MVWKKKIEITKWNIFSFTDLNDILFVPFILCTNPSSIDINIEIVRSNAITLVQTLATPLCMGVFNDLLFRLLKKSSFLNY
jgi:hypothetical protein